MKHHFYQSHASRGYSARVTIEWEAPEGATLDGWRRDFAEEIAGKMLAAVGGKTRNIVDAMRGRTDEQGGSTP